MAAAEGTTLQGRLDDIAARYGRHVIADRSIAHGSGRGRRSGCARCSPTRRPSSAAPTVADVTAFPEADLLRLTLEGGVRVQVRPSGTEPKVKLYGEAVDADPTPYLDALVPALSSDGARRIPILAGSWPEWPRNRRSGRSLPVRGA